MLAGWQARSAWALVAAGHWFTSEALIRADMQLAMQAFAQVKQGQAVHVKIVPATGTPGKGRKTDYGEHDDEPAYKGGDHAGKELHGGHHQRHIDQYDCPEIPASSADCLQPVSQGGPVNSLTFAVC
jgi:hypothetical protein